MIEHANGDGKDERRDLNLLGSAGLYYGRVVNARTVAQAAAMCEVAGQTCDASALHRIAEVIGRAEAGYYLTKFKYDADAEFYKDLAKEVGTDQPFKLRQVLTSPIYQISDRWVGWELGFDLSLASGDHGNDDGDEDPGEDLLLQERARYATLFTDDLTFWVTQELLHGMLQTAAVGLPEHPGERMSVLGLETGLNWDIKYSWNLQSVLFGNLSFHSSGEYHSNYGLHVETNYALGSRFLAGLAGNLCNGDTNLGVDTSLMEICAGDKKFHYDLMAHFRVYIF